MNLFEFELAPIDRIQPWGEEPTQSLSWFALTDGVFRVNVGNETLFRYSNEILERWDSTIIDANYQIAAFARAIFEIFPAAMSPIPNFLQSTAWDWDLLRKLYIESEHNGSSYEAFRWLGERSPGTEYLVESPQVSFIRKEDDIIIGWDNRERKIDGLQVWESDYGTYTLSAESFFSECRSFSERLLNQMQNRIIQVHTGVTKAPIELDTEELMEQHKVWCVEFENYFSNDFAEDMSWETTQKAFNTILKYSTSI